MLFLVFFLNLLYMVRMEKEITVSIDPGQKECFFQYLKIEQVLELDYQVIDGGQGEIDISFELLSPVGRLIVGEYKKPDSSHRITAEEDGDYQLCWDNTFSRFNSKTVFFEISIDGEEDPWDVDIDGDVAPGPEELYEAQILNMQNIICMDPCRMSSKPNLRPKKSISNP